MAWPSNTWSVASAAGVHDLCDHADQQASHGRAAGVRDQLNRVLRGWAKQVGISVSSVQRIWHTHGLQPHRVRQFKLSRDRQFVTKLRDIVGLYVDPPAHAVVLSVDEKSQIQALDRTQPGLPMKKGRCATMMHDYKRHGTTTLFAALNVLEGRIIGRCMQRHRHQWRPPATAGNGHKKKGTRREQPRTPSTVLDDLEFIPRYAGGPDDLGGGRVTELIPVNQE